MDTNADKYRRNLPVESSTSPEDGLINFGYNINLLGAFLKFSSRWDNLNTWELGRLNGSIRLEV
jgi:hypothetical protein